MLFLVGLGLSENDIPVGALDACKQCELYIDRFTTLIPERTLNRIGEITGKQITELTRQDMEEDADKIVKRALTRDIAILVGGDPLMATTHKLLFVEAAKHGVKTAVLHANSIITTAIGESGLDFYRFGGACTIPKWSAHYKPVSFYKKIEANLTNNMHSMLLLDYDAKKMETLGIPEAIEILENADAQYKKGIITNMTKIIILHNMQLDGKKVITTTIEDAKRIKENGVNIIILPAELTEIERETIEAMTGKRW